MSAAKKTTEKKPVAIDAGAEAALLSAAMVDATVVMDERFATSLFGEAIHERLATALVELGQRGEKLSPGGVLLLTKDEELAKLASKLITRPPSTSATMLIDRLEDVRDRARLADLCRRGHEAAFNEEASIKETLDTFEADALGLRPARGGLRKGSDMKDVLRLIRWRAMNPGKIIGRSTGIRKLDDLMDGLINSEMIIVAARPSCGKTSLICNMIEEEIDNGGVPLCFSMEMGATSLKMRLLAALARVPTGRMDRPYTPLEQRQLADAIKAMAGWNWFLDETPRADVRHIRATARRLKKEKKITSIWIDYIQLARGVRKSSQTDRRVEVGEISSEFKGMAKELDLPVIVACQIRRPQDVYDKVERRTQHQEPELHHLKESGDIEQDADQVILLDRDQRENATKATAILAKNRNGPTGRVELEYFPDQCRFRQAI